MMDDSYSDQKNFLNTLVSKSTNPLSVTNSYNYPQSHHAVLNAFRSDFEDFSQFTDNKLGFVNNGVATNPALSQDNLISLKVRASRFGEATQSLSTNSLSNLSESTYVNSPAQLNWSRLSNPVALRRSAKSSIVTYQSFQKVFKMRYEEGRAHVRLTDFADSSNTQPYTTEQRIKYERMLGKNKVRYFNTIYNPNHLLPIFNQNSTLTNSMNFYFYEFPFLDGLTNDPTRHV